MTRIHTIRLVTLLLVVAVIAMVSGYGCNRNPVDTTDVTKNAPTLNTPENPFTPIDTTTSRPSMQSTALASWGEINMRIWSSALYYVGQNTGQQCKVFASDRVRVVTGFALPTTQSNWIYFNSGHVVKIVDGNVAGGGSLRSGVSAGNIIQMHIYYRNPTTGKVTDLPHTAIFSEYASGGMYWIDCNFMAPGLVARHFVPWDWFSSRVGTKYSVYQATT